MDEQRIVEFVNFVKTHLNGSEKSEAQTFLDRLFKAYGNEGIIEAGATLEKQIIIDNKTKFCDLLWPNVVLIEMKSRGEKLGSHFQQAKTYWDNTYGNRPKYVILCNFNEFWIYNWNLQRDPLDIVPLDKLKDRWRSLAFLCPGEVKPLFGNNCVEVTEKAADKIAQLYNSLVNRGVDRVRARRFTLQCLVSLFAEDTDLFPNNTLFTALIDDCRNGQSTYDLFKILFEQMNSKNEATGGKFQGVRYFNGGVFSQVYPIDLDKIEIDILWEASQYDWSKVQPSIFGTIFEDSLGKDERHVTGAHYTLLSEIMSVVEPTILRPWRERIDAARTLKELNQIHEDLSRFQILDPACGSGNFLYIAYRELRFLEIELMKKMTGFPSVSLSSLHSKVKCSQFYGIDINPLGIELAKVTLSMAKKFTTEEFNQFTKQNRFINEDEDPLPFDNLDDNFQVGDALFVKWPSVNAIIGNPPYQSKNKMQKEFGPDYVQKLRDAYTEMPGRADYCVYWFRKAHDTIPLGGRVGLVGTNTIRQTNSRMGGLDYIIANDGVIVEAISSMPWGGSAVVHVSIVNWIKTTEPVKGLKKLREKLGETGNEPWAEFELDTIPASLSPNFDVIKAGNLKVNVESGACCQGQTHGHIGFLLSPEDRMALLQREPIAIEVTFPYMNADELIGSADSQPKRYIIDFQPRHTLPEAARYKETFSIVKEKVLPKMMKNAEDEIKEFRDTKRKVKARQQHLDSWWLLWRGRGELISNINLGHRYIACGQVTKRPIFEFISSTIHPNAALIAFPLTDDYSFGILQSSYHWEWFKARCSTLKDDPRYTTTTIFDTFPWPQWGITEKYANPSNVSDQKKCFDVALKVAIAGRELRDIRNKLRKESGSSLRELYRNLELPGKNPLKDAHENLDKAVGIAYSYGLSRPCKSGDELKLLYALNLKCIEIETLGKKIFGPGLPQFCGTGNEFTSVDCIRMI